MQPLEPILPTESPSSGDVETADDRRADRYVDRVLIGQGGMGRVYRARHRDLNQLRALKVMDAGRAADERFRREARLQAAIESQFVVKVFEYYRDADGSPVLVMEWIEGEDLYAKIRREGAQPEAQVEAWMLHVAQGMQAAAERGVIHRDLKPSNVLIDRGGRARVTDFGLARSEEAFDQLLTHEGAFMGTPAYVAPEQARSAHDVDTRADVYSYGATFYHALTGRVPFEAPSAFEVLKKHESQPLVSPRAHRPDLSEKACWLLEKCLAKSPADRFHSFADVVAYLKGAGTASPLLWEMQEEPSLRPHLERYRQRRDAYLTNPRSIGEETYDFPNGRVLRIVRGDVTQQRADVIVSSDDSNLTMGGGVSLAIQRASTSEHWKLAERFVPARPGRVVVTPAYGLHARFVFHAITLTMFRGESPSRALILEIVNSCLYHAETFEVTSLAMPLVGTGVGGFPHGDCLDVLFHQFCKTLQSPVTTLREVTIVLF